MVRFHSEPPNKILFIMNFFAGKCDGNATTATTTTNSCVTTMIMNIGEAEEAHAMQ
jgi:hypothetical protein